MPEYSFTCPKPDRIPAEDFSRLKRSKPKDIIIQINDTYQDGEDVSWLWDVDFQYLADSNAATITTCGTRKHDMGLRLKYEDIDCTSLMICAPVLKS